MPFVCPHCESDQTQKLSVIYESGTSVINTKSSHGAVGIADEGFVPIIGSSKTEGVQQTSLAANASPPPQKDEFGLVAVIISIVLAPVAGIIGLFLAAIVTKNEIVVACVLFLVPPLVILWASGKCFACRGNREWNRDVWPKLRDEWNRKWFCHKCGVMFTQED